MTKIKYEPREHIIDAELANGNLDAWRQALGFPRQSPDRRHRVSDCSYCNELSESGPSHDPSPRCESGKRNHCTCDTCF